MILKIIKRDSFFFCGEDHITHLFSLCYCAKRVSAADDNEVGPVHSDGVTGRLASIVNVLCGGACVCVSQGFTELLNEGFKFGRRSGQ